MSKGIDLTALWAAQLGRRYGGGQNGKSAYEYAVEGGYKGSEQEFAERLAALMNGSIVGYVNDAQEITVTGKLADGAYAVFYEMDNGTLVKIGDLTLAEATPTNLLPLAENQDGTAFGNGGYTVGARISRADGSVKTDECASVYYTGFINLGESVDTVFIEGITEYEANSSYNNFAFYNASHGYVEGSNLLATNTANLSYSNGVYAIAVPSGATYIRFSCGLISADTVVTAGG